MILAVTGHRPHYLQGGYSDSTRRRLVALATSTLRAIQPDHVRTGMAQGWDQACAEAARTLGLPYTAVVPGLINGTQDMHWPQHAQERYLSLLEAAADVEWCPFAGAGREYVARDRQLIAPADMLLALWNGARSGTGTTVSMARCPVWNVWREWNDG